MTILIKEVFLEIVNYVAVKVVQKDCTQIHVKNASVKEESGHFQGKEDFQLIVMVVVG